MGALATIATMRGKAARLYIVGLLNPTALFSVPLEGDVVLGAQIQNTQAVVEGVHLENV